MVAKIASPLSSLETVATEGAAAGTGRWAAALAALGGAEGRFGLPPATRLTGAPEAGGGGTFDPMAAGAAAAAAGAAAGIATGAAVPALTGGAPAGSVGNLMVGEAVGLGGKLMRTVSFLG